MVKTPVFPIHTWLPVVHSESPLSGSILLAGVILKLAIYSCIRILIPILNEGTILYTPLIFVIGVITIIYTSLATIRQMDVKVVIAYSSIGHMGTCLLGIFANNLAGINGSIMLSICHGFVSPALFLCVGGILYDRYHVRISNYFQGLATVMPLFMVFFFIFSLANIATPLSGNFLGEFLSLTGAFQRAPIFGFLGASSILLTAIYMMKFNSRITGGILPYNLFVTYDLRSRELIILISLLYPVILLGIVPTNFTDIISFSAQSLIYNL
jgi:NADH-ubiquinone oxidoreductase chain 4